ncbi:hypothetical protein N8I74_14440 [Chitiniphilus purpureus]|uniref:Type VI secretion system baseplate subunit TssG n=1 Tax=Chitiniphilus purpureus TaxID=2981137 RepID=A0ABY6DKE4_9NEIS|nr:hypothetical protein [Chitiniphilus sp. CD1]UXY14507.1 hypothetical protein N8I74_14440 [Chitiniphilus sp. CD1]
MPNGKRPMADYVKHSLVQASSRLGVKSPLAYVNGLIDRSFSLPEDDLSYADNALTPGAVPFEPSFSETEPNALRFTIEPLGPNAPPVARRDEATREMRRLIAPCFGNHALRWFDQRSEEWRGMNGLGWMSYGAWFGSAFDEDGLYAAKIYYELTPSQINALAPELARLTQLVMGEMPSLFPIFTSIGCKRELGSQRVTFMHRGPLTVSALGPLMNRLGIGHQLPSLMRVVGVALGGRFELPHGGVLLGLRQGQDGVELKLEILLAALPDLPSRFLDLLRLGLAERPRQLAAMERWLTAFGMGDLNEPGHFSVLSVRVTPKAQARISLYVRPIEFEMRDVIEEGRNAALA